MSCENKIKGFKYHACISYYLSPPTHFLYSHTEWNLIFYLCEAKGKI